VGGTHTFRVSSPARGRYLLIWFTRLPPAGPDRFQAEVYGITVRGSAETPAPAALTTYSGPVLKRSVKMTNQGS
jgi:hypothetical protein